MASPISVVILAAGRGTRMKSATPKVLHQLCGRPMLAWVLDQARCLDPQKVVLVVGHEGDRVGEAAHTHAQGLDLEVVHQTEQRGTGHAVQVAAPALGDDPGTVVVLYGDMPLLHPITLIELLEEREEAGADAVALLSAWVEDPRAYGRVLRDESELFVGIVEDKDCTPEQAACREINLGVYAFPGKELLADLPKLSDDNAQGELYLTDLPGMARAAGRTVAPLIVEDSQEGLGVNDLRQLAEVRWELQARILAEHMSNGVEIVDPTSAWVDHGVDIGPGTKLLPGVVIASGVKIGAGCCVGPFTHLRTGAVLEDGAEVGNFCEMKNSTLGPRSKAKHLSYLGDVTVGERANIGAGTIFANYDGKAKHPTKVGDRAFIGSGTIVVAPNEVPERSTTGAGAVITRSAKMNEGEVWVGMPARRLREKQD